MRNLAPSSMKSTLGFRDDHTLILFQAIQLIQQENKLKVPEGYADDFRKTDAVFKYQSVFDPKRKKIVRLNEVSETENVTEEDLRYAGPYPSILLQRG